MVKAKILIIEDDRSLAEVLAYNCRQAGYEVETFSDAVTRYLAVTGVTSLGRNDLQGKSDVTRSNDVTPKKSHKYNKNNECYGVTSKIQDAGKVNDFFDEKAPF